MIVCKFGGSSVASASQIRKVKSIVEADKRRSIVIVSAPGKRMKGDAKVTDLLYKCNEAVQMGVSSREVFGRIEERYLSILQDLKMGTEQFQQILENIRQKIDAGYGAEYAASRGEHLNARLIAKFLGWEFLDTENVVIIKADGTVDPVTYENIKEGIDPSKRYIIPGFYGSDSEGRVRTFSRGGSDITGAIFAKACGAEVYENWTDVSGVFSVDPRIVPDAHVVATMTYREVRELAGVGAGVFHEEAIAPVYGSNIPINVKNTNVPGDPGTMIVPSREEDDIVGVSAKGGFSRLTVRKLMLFKKSGIRHGLLTLMQVFGVRPSFSLFGIDSVVWLFDSKLASESILRTMCARLKSEFDLDEVTVDHGYAVLGVIGQGLPDHPEIAAKVCEALKDAGIRVSFINYGASEDSTLFGIDEEVIQKAQQVVYRAIFTNDTNKKQS
ncbi:MAG: aspartate kinase [Sphaerochaetaceae bacterium]|jgi:aspartate kinase